MAGGASPSHELCRVDGCDNKIDLKKHQLCSKHYQAFWRYGDPLGSPTASVIETQRCRVWFGLAPAAAQPDVLGA